MAFALSSPAFDPNAPIPRRHTLDGENLSPPLEWRDAPKEAKSYVLFVEDHDAPNGTFHHWALYNIPGSHHRLPEGVGEEIKLGKMALNDFQHHRYDGPQPPKGHGKHHYHFKLAALDIECLSAEPQARVADIRNIARDHIIAEAETVGVYER